MNKIGGMLSSFSVILLSLLLQSCTNHPHFSTGGTFTGPPYYASSDSLARIKLKGDPFQPKIRNVLDGIDYFSDFVYLNSDVDPQKLERLGFRRLYFIRSGPPILYSCFVPWGIDLDHLPTWIDHLEVDDFRMFPPPQPLE